MNFAPEIHEQVADLTARYGIPIRASITLPDGGFDPFRKPDRIGEVCMVIRRPNGHLLTARKTFYPRDAYRLLTGGIAPGEPVEAALLREVQEETGLEVTIRTFLAVIEYTARSSDPQPGRFYTFVFLLDETGGILEPQDPTEQIAGFREVLPQELPALATSLEHAPDEDDPEISGRWRSWGIFRAIVHRMVYATLIDVEA